MTPRRRAVVLLALASVLGVLAASDVQRRERAVDRELGPLRPVVVARVALAPGAPLRAGGLAVRRVPQRYVPHQAFARPDQVEGLRTMVGVPAGTDLVPALVGLGPDAQHGGGAALAPGETVASVVAAGSTAVIRPGTRVDVLVTRDGGAAVGGGSTTLAVSGVRVLSARAVRSDDPGPHVVAELLVPEAAAVYLTAAQNFAREIRLLPRSGAGGGARAGLTVRSSLYVTR